MIIILCWKHLQTEYNSTILKIIDGLIKDKSHRLLLTYNRDHKLLLLLLFFLRPIRCQYSGAWRRSMLRLHPHIFLNGFALTLLSRQHSDVHLFPTPLYTFVSTQLSHECWVDAELCDQAASLAITLCGQACVWRVSMTVFSPVSCLLRACAAHRSGNHYSCL